MLPSEKAERWVRRVGYAALALVVLYIVIWVVRFVSGAYGRAMEQRQPPAEGQAAMVEPARQEAALHVLGTLRPA